jgi:hypothetical protein
VSLGLVAPSFTVAFTARLTNADAANTSYFALSNPIGSGKTIVIKQVEYSLGFDGTAAAGTSVSMSIVKASSQGNPTTGTGLTPVPTVTLAPSVLTNANVMFKATALTITITTSQGSIGQISLPISVTAQSISGEINWAEVSGAKGQRLAPGEGITIQNERAAVVGQILSMTILWDEVPTN